MKNLMTCIIVALLGINSATAGRESKKLFNLEIGHGLSYYSTTSNVAPTLHIIPRFNLSDKFSLGSEIEIGNLSAGVMESNKGTIGFDDFTSVKFGLNAEYSRPKGNFMPFAGLGLNYWGYTAELSDVNIAHGPNNYANATNIALGFSPKIGIQWKYFRASMEYNISAGNHFTSNGKGAIASKNLAKPEYLSFKLAGVIGAKYWR